MNPTATLESLSGYCLLCWTSLTRYSVHPISVQNCQTRIKCTNAKVLLLWSIYCVFTNEPNCKFRIAVRATRDAVTTKQEETAFYITFFCAVVCIRLKSFEGSGALNAPWAWWTMAEIYHFCPKTEDCEKHKTNRNVVLIWKIMRHFYLLIQWKFDTYTLKLTVYTLGQ